MNRLEKKIIQHRADMINMTNIMTKYTEEILIYINNDISTIIKQYIDNYKANSSNKLSIRLHIDGDNHIHIMKIADSISKDTNKNNELYELREDYNILTFKYNTNRKLNLLKKNLENYIKHFMPQWNEYIEEHYIVVCNDTAQSYYHLTIDFNIGIKKRNDWLIRGWTSYDSEKRTYYWEYGLLIGTICYSIYYATYK